MDLKVIDRHKQESSITSPAAFEKCLGIYYLPRLLWKDEKVAKAIEKRYRRAHRDCLISHKQKWLGCYYGKDLDSEFALPLTISWIDDAIGYGVFTSVPIAVKTFIGEYTGIVRKWRLFGRWENYYCFDYMIGAGESSSYVIDAKCSGNHTRFINHSFEPNVELVSVDYEGQIRVLLYAKRQIEAGEQLLYDYGDDYWSKRPTPMNLSS